MDLSLCEGKKHRIEKCHKKAAPLTRMFPRICGVTSLVLVVDDEKDLAKTLQINLRLEGYETRLAFSGYDALQASSQLPTPNLVILDLMLPDIPGNEVCKWIRSKDGIRDIPILMLTAKGEEVDRVAGFEVGADDYVVKPFSVREIMQRVRVLLKRTAATKQPPPELLRFRELQVDCQAHCASVNDIDIPLTALEFRLLVTLLTNKGRVYSRKHLLATIWGIHADVTTRTVDIHVQRLRTKLGSAGNYIETLRGVGYRFRARARP